MRVIRPDFKCPKCKNLLTDCETDEKYDSWGITKCKNPKCDYWVDAYDLTHKYGQKVLTIG
jgi:hypothetical protein